MSSGPGDEQNAQPARPSLPLRKLRVLDRTVEVGELCGRLLADLGADVVLHSSIDDLQLAHAAQVVCSITWFGRTGPYANRPGCDDVVVGMSGWLSQNGVAEKPPLLVPGAVGSDAASTMGFLDEAHVGWIAIRPDRAAPAHVATLDTALEANAGIWQKVASPAAGVELFQRIEPLPGTPKIEIDLRDKLGIFVRLP